MSQTVRGARFPRVRILLVCGFACVAFPSLASASSVNLATASPFVVLGGSAVTNTGPSVLNGDLGIAPGTSLTGFGSPGVVNGATHDDDAVAVQAQDDLTTAYNAAAAQPVAPADVLTGQDLGGLTLTPGAYSFASSAQLTGTLTLNAEGNPDAQFVFEIGSTLTTASASSVVLINGASPCDVFWQIGSSATLGTNTAFAGNLMASDSISLDSGSDVQGRALASTGAVTLDDNTLDNSMCTSASVTSGPTPTPTPTPAPTSGPTSTSTSTTTASTPTPTASTTAPTSAPSSTSTATASTPVKTKTPVSTKTPVKAKAPTATPASSHTRPRVLRHRGSAALTFSTPSSATVYNEGFTVSVSGREIKRVVFTVNGKRVATRRGSPFRIHVGPDYSGGGVVTAHVTFKDATHARTLTRRYRASVAVSHPLPAPSTFTG